MNEYESEYKKQDFVGREESKKKVWITNRLKG